MVQSFRGATVGHPMYADGTPLKVKIAFDDGQTHEYKTASWHKLRVVPGTAYQPSEPQAPSGVSEEEIAPGLVVGARVEHVKHGHGTIQHIDLEAKRTKVKVAFDTGETHEYKGGSLDKLRVMQAAEIQAAKHDSSVVVALADRAVLLEGKAHWKAESAFYKPATVQLLAATGHDGTPDADAGAPPWSIIVINGKAVPYEEVTAMRVEEKFLEFVVERTRQYSSRAERLHLRMDTRSEFRLWRDALRPEMIKPRGRSVASRATLILKSGQASPSKGATLVAEERVLLEGRMSVRISGSPFHVPMVLKLTAVSDSAERKEPWTTFSYTTNHNTVAVPCRAISAVRIHAGDANPSFEIEYAAPREAEVRKNSLQAEGRKKSLPRVSIRMRIWTTSQEQFEAWRKALAPLPLVNVHAMDRARLWLDNHMSELPGAVDEGEQKGSKKTFDGSV